VEDKDGLRDRCKLDNVQKYMAFFQLRMNDRTSTKKPSKVVAPVEKKEGPSHSWDDTNIEGKGGIGVGAIVGIIIAVIVVLLLIAGVGLYFKRKGDHKTLAQVHTAKPKEDQETSPAKKLETDNGTNAQNSEADLALNKGGDRAKTTSQMHAT